MRTSAGRHYRVSFTTAGPAAMADPSWLVGPLAAKYGVDVVSVARGGPGVLATVRWTRAPGAIEPGDSVGDMVPGAGIVGTNSTATVTSVEDLGPSGRAPAGSSAFWNLVGAAVLLVTTFYLVRRVR